MEQNPKIIIVDCDHDKVDTEKAVFDKAGEDFRWLHCLNEEEVIRECQGAVCFLNQYCRMNAKVFEAIPTLKFIVRYGVGVDNVNLEDATKYGVQVCNVPDYGMNEVADQALTLMLGVVRKAWMLAERTRKGEWNYADAIPVHRLSEMTVGIVGTGRIGREFAERVHALKCTILAYDPQYAASGAEKLPYITYVDTMDELLAQSDIVSLHCSLDERNRHMMNREAFAKMKDGSYLVNVSRGGLVDEAALDEALTSGKIAGAGLDVFNNEPIEKDNPLFRHENVLITPHEAWYSEEAALELKRKCAEEAVRFLKGEPVKYPVNHIDRA